MDSTTIIIVILADFALGRWRWILVEEAGPFRLGAPQTPGGVNPVEPSPKRRIGRPVLPS